MAEEQHTNHQEEQPIEEGSWLSGSTMSEAVEEHQEDGDTIQPIKAPTLNKEKIKGYTASTGKDGSKPSSSPGVKQGGKKQSLRVPREYYKNKLMGATREKRLLTDTEVGEYLSERYGAEELEGITTSAGFEYTSAEYRLIQTLMKLNRDLSLNRSDNEAEDYLKGNGRRMLQGYKTLPEQMKEELVVERNATIKTSWGVVAREYYGKDKVDSKERKFVVETAQGLAKRNFPVFIYLRGKAKPIITYTPLIRLVADTNTGENLFALNPIFTRGIEDDYINTPEDAAEQLAAAYGSTPPSGFFDFYDTLILMQRDGKRTRTYGMAKLSFMIARPEMESRQPKKARAKVIQALETMKKIGLLSRYDIQEAKDGGEKVVLSISPYYETNLLQEKTRSRRAGIRDDEENFLPFPPLVEEQDTDASEE